MHPATLPTDQYPLEALVDASPVKSWRVISEELGMPEPTVYQTGMRALAKLRVILERQR